VKDCPGEAIIGENWNVGKPLAEYYDARKCFEKAKELSKLYLGKDITVCGKCIEVCPYTKGYLNER
jgi:epoxyqueuosine reductase QueG